MSSVSIAVEPLTPEEARMIAKSRIAHVWLLAISSIVGVAFLIALGFGVSGSSFGELLFMSAIALLVVVGLGFLMHMFIGIWRDYRTSTKLVVRGTVIAVDRRTDSNGLHYAISVGEKFVASDPLYSPIPGYLSQVRVGDFVQISYLAHSRRTLCVVPA